MSDDRPSVYEEDGKTIWRASSLGQCKSALAWALLGTEPEPWPESFKPALAQGAAMEDTLIAKMVDHWDLKPSVFEFPIDESGQELLEMSWGKEIIRCHPDGVYNLDGDDHAIEVKFVGDALWNKLNTDIKLMPNYAWQASIEIVASGLPLLYGVGRKDKDGKLIDFYSKRYAEPPFSKGQIKKRVAEVRALLLEDDMPNCEYAMFPCPYHPFHTESDPMWAKAVTTLEGDKAAIFDDIMDGYLTAKRIIDEQTVVKKKASGEYAALMEESDIAGGDRVQTENHTVTYVKQKRNRTDYKKMIADHDIDVKKYESSYEVVYPKEVAE